MNALESREPRTHQVQVSPADFAKILANRPYVFATNDQDYRVGDTVDIVAYDASGVLPGEPIRRVISSTDVPEMWMCVLGLEKTDHHIDAFSSETLCAAKAWWQSLRPAHWSLDEHTNDPNVNTSKAPERVLAAAIARLCAAES